MTALLYSKQSGSRLAFHMCTLSSLSPARRKQAGADSDFEINLVSEGEEEEAAEAGSEAKGKGKAPPKKKAKASQQQQQQQTPSEPPAKVGARFGGEDWVLWRLIWPATLCPMLNRPCDCCWKGRAPDRLRSAPAAPALPAQRAKSATPGGSKKKAKATGPLAGLQGELLCCIGACANTCGSLCKAAPALAW